MLVCPFGFLPTNERSGSSLIIQEQSRISQVKKVQTNQKSIFSSSHSLVSSKFMAPTLSLKRHRRGKRNSLKLISTDFRWVGNNIAGAKSKWASVQRWVCNKSPSILSLQETKFQVHGKHKLQGYITYEHLRTEKIAGGGLLLAIKKDLSPALVRDGGSDVEALTVDIFVKKMQVTCITAYGPQENEKYEKRTSFGNT